MFILQLFLMHSYLYLSITTNYFRISNYVIRYREHGNANYFQTKFYK
jgi:hypothetical protein